MNSTESIAGTFPALEPRDLEIPLDVHSVPLDAIEEMVNPVIEEHVKKAIRDGWQVDGPTDILTLWRLGRVQVREHSTFWSDKHTYSLQSVSIRFRRASTAGRTYSQSPDSSGHEVAVAGSSSDGTVTDEAKRREGIMTTTVERLLAGKSHDVWSVAPGTSVYDAIGMMADKGIGALPVVEGDKLVGIVSERDYARKVILKGRSSRDTSVRDIMTEEVYAVRPDETIEQCMAVMTEARIRHLPVLKDGRLVGIVSIGDLVKSLLTDKDRQIQQLETYIAGSKA